MTDVFDKQKRSFVMSQVRGSKNKSTELKLISIFKELGITGWRRGSKMNGKCLRTNKMDRFVHK